MGLNLRVKQGMGRQSQMDWRVVAYEKTAHRGAVFGWEVVRGWLFLGLGLLELGLADALEGHLHGLYRAVGAEVEAVDAGDAVVAVGLTEWTAVRNGDNNRH